MDKSTSAIKGDNICVHTMKNVHIHELLRVACVHTLPILGRSVQKGSERNCLQIYYKPMKAIKQRSKECFIVSDFFN